MTPITFISRRMAAALLVALPAMTIAAPFAAMAEFPQAPAAYFPNIPDRASAPEGFLMPGMKLEKVAKGDLDGDLLPDLAMIIRMDDPKNVLRDPEEADREPLDTNPRMIAIAMADKAGGFTIDAVNLSMIPRLEDPFMNDPFVDLSIDKGAVKLLLEQSSNAGSWGSATMTFTFRKRGQDVALVGFDRTDVNRASGEMTETSVNFLTGREVVSTGNVSTDKMSKKLNQLPKRALPTLNFMGDAFSFDPHNP
ncbi:MAG: hypothetical protein HGB02_06860 [Chlorobiaceae bacterium]|nr:hypothetical protein [Chlorobiaceae bacterium]